tara:strand:+ start:621 stop:932 length:312 start_codon:yes stop_codon:yes gene_type:complete
MAMKYAYAKGTKILLGDVEHIVGEPSPAYVLADAEGNELTMTEAQLDEEGTEVEEDDAVSAGEEEGDTGESASPVDLSTMDLSKMDATAKAALMSKLKKEAGL